MIREIYENELDQILELYTYLHEETIPEMTEHLKSTWDMIMQDKNHHIIVEEIDGKIVSSYLTNYCYKKVCDKVIEKNLLNKLIREQSECSPKEWADTKKSVVCFFLWTDTDCSRINLMD